MPQVAALNIVTYNDNQVFVVAWSEFGKHFTYFAIHALFGKFMSNSEIIKN